MTADSWLDRPPLVHLCFIGQRARHAQKIGAKPGNRQKEEPNEHNQRRWRAAQFRF